MKHLLNILLFALASLLSAMGALLAPPTNDECSDAIVISVGNECTPEAFSTADATTESTDVAQNPTCGFYQGNDVWFTFTAPASGQFRIEVEAIENNATWVLYSGSCGEFNQILCASDAQNIRRNFNDPALGGMQLYLRVFRFASTTPIDFTLCIFEIDPPVNDNCENATAITVTDECEPQNFSTSFTTAQSSTVAPSPSCGFFQGNDMWFTFTAPTSGQFRIEVEAPGNNATWVLYSGSCGEFNQILCASDAQNIRRNFNDPALGGMQLYLRVFRFASTTPVDFTLCIFEIDPPVNDNCENATAITVTDECQPQNFSTAFSTAQSSTVAPSPSCGFFNGNDVWFTFTVPASGQFRIEVEAPGNNATWVLYSGSCGEFNQILCASSVNDIRRNFDEPALGGMQLYLRVFRFASTTPIDFALCIFEIDPPVNDNCENATAITVTDECQPQNFSTAFSTAQSSTVAPSPSCGFFNGNDVWFTFTVPASGQFRIEVEALGNNATWVLYSGSCGEFNQILCASSGNDIRRNFNDPDLGGMQLYLRVFRFASTTPIDFTLCIFETEPPVNDNCANALHIDLNEVCQGEVYTTQYATTEATSVAPNPSCGFFAGNDVWFTFNVPANGEFRIDASASAINSSWALYSGSCENFTQLACAGSGSQLQQNFALPELAGQLLYLRVFRFASTVAMDFNICIFEIATPVNDNCANALELIGLTECAPEVFSSVFSTSESVDLVGEPSCGFYTGGDTWFRFTAPVTGQFTIETQHFSGPSTHLSLYSGSCGAFIEIDCNAAGLASYNDPNLANQELYLRFWAQGSAQGSTFSVCLVFHEPPANDLCENAFTLPYNELACEPSSYTTAFASWSAEQQAAPGCGGFTGGDVWFTLQMPESGPVQLQLDGSANALYYAAVYTGNCQSLVQQYCIGSSGALNIVNNSLAGENLLIRVRRFGNSEGGEFTLCAGPANCLADFNFDGLVNSTDLSLFLAEFGCSGTCSTDLNGDTIVNSTDLSIFLSAFSALCIN